MKSGKLCGLSFFWSVNTHIICIAFIWKRFNRDLIVYTTPKKIWIPNDHNGAAYKQCTCTVVLENNSQCVQLYYLVRSTSLY